MKEVLKHGSHCNLEMQRVELCLIIALIGQSKETFCALLNLLCLFSFAGVNSKDIESVRTVQSRKTNPKGDMIGVQLCQSTEMKRINCSPSAS